MCGICGLYGLSGNDDVEVRVRRMVRTIAHRGPDAEGTFVEAGVALGHRRLSIIDPSAAGAQPMTFGRVTVVYNGESFNFPELRQELVRQGHQFIGHSDTEVLLHAYAAWGLEGLARLEGMFAFALWDAARRRLVLMRDRLGIKPLYYASANGQLAFGSEIKAILAGVELDRSIDDQALAEYLWYGNSFEDRTIYRNIRALQPGHRLVIENGKQRVEPWWRVEDWLREGPQIADGPAAAVAAPRAIDAAVDRQLVSDVPVGIFLSGGIDSSSIAAAAAASGRRLSSFSVGFDYEHGVNELPKAGRVAQAFGLDHHELRGSGGALDEVLMRLVAAHDEPFADAANIPLYLLAQEVSGSIKVVLQGDGGDEMFAGYRRYAILRHVALWRAWSGAIKGLTAVIPGALSLRLGRLAAAAGQSDPALRVALLLTVDTLRDPPTALLEAGARARLEELTDPFVAYRRCALRFASVDPVQQMLLTDVALQLPCQFLTKVDRATMAHGIEARVPLLDEQVAALAIRMPSTLKVRGTEKKLVLRQAMRGRVPSEVLDGPKTGFGVPYEEWLRGSLHDFARAALLDAAFVERFGLNRERLVSALDQHQARHRDRGFLLWKLLQLSLWSRHKLH